MYTENTLVRVAKRENNTKRSYLVLNQLQGKHMASDPMETLAMFDQLAQLLAEAYRGKRVLIVGFAETATAIGSRLAIKMDSLYMQTTREKIEGVEYLYFTESHSHAVEQKLIQTDLDQIIDEIDHIIFAEDEVTTGNTILKIVELIRQTYSKKVNFSAACLLNGMDEQAQQRYRDKEICLYYLVKTNHSLYPKLVENYPTDGSYLWNYSEVKLPPIKQWEITGYVDGRRLQKGSVYAQACQNLWEQLQTKIDVTGRESVLVIGTEEFMYPAIYVAGKIREKGGRVKTHSTTRSPMVVSRDEVCPLHCRYELRSLYEKERKTYIYDIGCYDKVLILTDAREGSEVGLDDLCRAVVSKGNRDIQVIRWIE